MRKHLHPVERADEKAFAQNLRDLGNDTFVVRQRAFAAIEKSGDRAMHLLQDALKATPNLEVKRRLETLLGKLDSPFEQPAQLRAYRCLTLLERFNTPESRQLLEYLAAGAPTAWLTVEARNSLGRGR